MPVSVDYTGANGPQFNEGIETNRIDEATAASGTYLQQEYLLLGAAGVRIKNNAGVFEVRTNADGAYASARVLNLTVDGDLTVSGSLTTINTTEIVIEDEIMLIASGQTGVGGNAGIQVDRSTLTVPDTNASLLWNQSSEYWMCGVVGSETKIALDPTTTSGDILQSNGTNLTRLGIGLANQLLRVNAGATALEYYTPAAGHTQNTDTGTTSISFAINSAGTGTLLKSDGGGNLQIRNLGDTLYEDLVALTFGDGTDTMTPQHTTYDSWTLGYGYAAAGRNYNFIVERGAAGADAYIRWNETTDTWDFYNGASTSSSSDFHTQNTDTGTTSTSFAINSGGTGTLLKNDGSGNLQIKNLADSLYEDLSAKTFVATNGTNSATYTFHVSANHAAVTSTQLWLNEGNAGATSDLYVERGGTGNDVSLRWDESDDVWKLSNDGTAWNQILTTASVLQAGAEWRQYETANYSQWMVVYWGNTNGTSPIRIYEDGDATGGGSVSFAIPNNSSMMVEALITARDTVANTTAAWRYEFSASKTTTAASMSVTNSVKSIIYKGIGANSDVAITADTSGGILNISVTSHTVNLTHWTVAMRVAMTQL